MPKFLLGFISITILTFVCCQCKDTPLNPDFSQITSHEYTWEVDTLHAPDALQVMMSGIWGTDENNVWVVGHSDDAKYQIWHWDGQDWENHHLLFSGHPHSLESIYGFGASDIWVVGTDYQNYPNTVQRSFITQYNGNQWNLIDEIDAPFCRSVWGSDPSNVFVGCDSGFVLKYNGSQWEKQYTHTRAQIKSIWGISPTEVYAVGEHGGDIMPVDSIFYYFFKYDGKEWSIVEQTLDYPFAPLLLFGSELWGANRENVYSVGAEGIYKRENNAWSYIAETRGLFFVNGSSANNIFTGGFGNNLYHFNGFDWYHYEELIDNSRWFTAGWSNRQFTFIIGRAAGKSFIYRGKQKG